MIFWLPPLLAAPFAGSVAGVLIRRLPRGQSVVLARSECESCRHVLAPIDLVPIGSFLWLRGRCRFCRLAIDRFHMAVECAAVVVAGLAALVDDSAGKLWADCGLGWVLLTLGWIDARHYILPDVLTLPLVVAGLCVTWLLARDAVAAHALGAIVGYSVFQGIALVYRSLRGRSGLGRGDAKLLAAAGAWTGIAALPTIVFDAALFGIAMVLLFPVARKSDLNKAVPFGPALAIAILLVRLFPMTADYVFLPS